MDSWFPHLKGFEIGASCQEIRCVYGIRYTYYAPRGGVYDHSYLEASAAAVVVIVTDLPVDDAPIVVGGIEGGENPPGDADLCRIIRGTLERLCGLQRQRVEGVRREGREVLGVSSIEKVSAWVLAGKNT